MKNTHINVNRPLPTSLLTSPAIHWASLVTLLLVPAMLTPALGKETGPDTLKPPFPPPGSAANAIHFPDFVEVNLGKPAWVPPDPPYHDLACGETMIVFTNDDVNPRWVTVSLTTACPGSYIIVSDPHLDCEGEQRIEMPDPKATSLPFTAVRVCPGGEITVFCNGSDGEGCDYTVGGASAIPAKPHQALDVLEAASGQGRHSATVAQLLHRIDFLTRQLDQAKPLEVTVNCGETDRLIFANGSWNQSESASGQDPISVTIEVISSCTGAEIVADIHGFDEQLTVTDGDDLAENGHITKLGFSVKSGGGIFLTCPGIDADDQCTARIWVHGPTPEVESNK